MPIKLEDISRWRGWWKCTVCGEIVPHRKANGGHATNRMHDFGFYPDCPGPVEPYERRKDMPEKEHE